MYADPKPPISVRFCNSLICGFAYLVPAEHRHDWKSEWRAEIWHRWQFLFHAGAWDARESVRLMRNCCGALADAVWHLASQEGIREPLRNWARSPWVCLGSLLAPLLIVALFTSGLGATRHLLASSADPDLRQLLFIWLHPVVGGGDRRLPPDVVPAWSSHSQLLESVAAFRIAPARFTPPGMKGPGAMVIITDPALFRVLRARPILGSIASDTDGAVVLDHGTWTSLFHSDRQIIGSQIRVGGAAYRVQAVLPAGFRFLSRQHSLYVVDRVVNAASVMVVARARPGATAMKISRELEKISEDVCYYFFGSQLRMELLSSGVVTPVESFSIAVVVSALLCLAVWRPRMRYVRTAWSPGHRTATTGRAAFFACKITLALCLIFIAGLEWSRSESSILWVSRDPASGPFLLWLYLVGAMGVSFWSVMDQRARCRVCLRLLCFPVRIGCPGCLLLGWSGTELFCTEGHGLLHVPHLAPSWDEESEHWISLDESWRELFVHTR